MSQELGKEIINIPVTFGSNLARQAGRAQELAQACRYLGWNLHPGRDGLQALEAGEVMAALTAHQPEAIFFPHEKDWNSRHLEINQLLKSALAGMPKDFSCHIIETEYWGAMSDPNLMVAGSAEDVAELIAATSFHQGEVTRNPYHLSLPFWMQDNVRRGSELVGGQGQSAPNFTFATLYRLNEWKQGRLRDLAPKNRINSAGPNYLSEALLGIS
ncbi:hypothetical protein [Roseibacillus persicicus]|uniref:hypothetical protein n=1 Tax=Roseibacillus persicicus TaxID=454148 RepID=UPI00280E0A12|nr:hypothetical protein [Roseibacillus persicicus]MDQ8192604.1 hypothetical protein [Roseibacillus persicicus]